VTPAATVLRRKSERRCNCGLPLWTHPRCPVCQALVGPCYPEDVVGAVLPDGRRIKAIHRRCLIDLVRREQNG
jgi:hypothetical protein